jgi:hypothetical protein
MKTRSGATEIILNMVRRETQNSLNYDHIKYFEVFRSTGEGGNIYITEGKA